MRFAPRRKVSGLAVLALVAAGVSLNGGQGTTGADDAALAQGHPSVRAVALGMDSFDALDPEASATEPKPVFQTPTGTIVQTVARTVPSETLSGNRNARWTASALSSHDVPLAADRAYKRAARTMTADDPACHIPWTLLAGIGRVESDHGRYGGSVLDDEGISRPQIIGVRLDGAGPVAAIRDTDNGRLDKDKVWDRAVGPMQFLPSTWALVARDGDRDGKKSPNDLDDAALAAAAYLCSGSGNILPDASMRAAILRYNPSSYYVDLVMAFERGYQTGEFVIPSPPAEITPPKHHRHKANQRKRHALAARRAAEQASVRATKHKAKPTPVAVAPPKPVATPKPVVKPTLKPQPTAAPKPTVKPQPTAAPKPTVKPQPTPAYVTIRGSLGACGSGWCVGSTPLDLGSPDILARRVADFDSDGQIEQTGDELAGLNGQKVTVMIVSGGSAMVVYTINGHDFRYADGSFA